jgi:hypothetical protein
MVISLKARHAYYTKHDWDVKRRAWYGQQNAGRRPPGVHLDVQVARKIAAQIDLSIAHGS